MSIPRRRPARANPTPQRRPRRSRREPIQAKHTDATLAGSALRVSDSEAPLLALHAGDGGRDLRHSAGAVPTSGRNAVRQFGPRADRGVLSTRWAGRSIPSACSTFAPPRSFSCCWGTWDVRAAASWRCAGTHRFRARPIFRRSTICCPAISPCPRRNMTRISQTYLKLNESPSGWWGEFPKYFVSLMKAWFGDAATKENDWCYDYLPHAHRRSFPHEHRRRYGGRQA